MRAAPMNLDPGSFSVLCRRAAVVLGAVLVFVAAPRSQAQALRPAEITFSQSQQAPYRDSGRLYLFQGGKPYIGTASYIRRYTGLTAGHILYSPKQGFTTTLHYEPALYLTVNDSINVSSFAVLSGYQGATAGGDNTEEAFDQDMGYLVFSKPAPDNEWAVWSDNPAYLLGSGPFLLLGYAAQSFEGDKLASVQHRNPYNQLLAPALYENQAYYTEGGMSGGPVYVTLPGGTQTLAAVNVAGTDYSDPADSLARAITPSETPLLLGAEYSNGIITGGIIQGPSTVMAGGTLKLKTGLVFADGPQINNPVAARYDGDLKLVASGPYKKLLTLTKVKPGRYNVAFPASVPRDAQVSFKLLRTALPQKGQTPLQTLTVTVR